MHDSTWYLSSFDAKSGITNSNEVAALGWVCGNKSVNLQLVIAERREESEKSKLLHDRYDKGWQTLEPYIREICGSKDNPRPLEKLVGIPQLNIEEMLNQGLTARQTIKECTKAYYELRRT